MIYARPEQTPQAWSAELQRALDLGPEHLSLYQLVIEPGTQFHGALRRGELSLLDEEIQADLYEATNRTLDAAGLPAYEVSNHARPGAECRHNLTYWRYGDYIGIGLCAWSADHFRINAPRASIVRLRSGWKG